MLEKMFPKDGEDKPEIRFAGFTDAWEQRKLGELCSTFADGDWIEAKDQSNGGIRLLQTGNVGVNEYLDKLDRTKWISEATFSRLNCTEVFPGNILISRLPEPAGRACIVPNTGQKMITAVDCTIVRTSEKCASEFLVQHLSSEKYFEIVNGFLAGGTRQRISRSNLAKFIVPLPSVPEQRKIGAFFTSLCHLITLHQRELTKLRNIKKALLEKMFVSTCLANEQSVEEI
jgi:type I restriction enzyme S subunit